MSPKLGSLFDGSGGFPLAGVMCGISPVWASEIEPYPIAVTKSRFPKMKHIGDVSKVNGAEIEPVDVITFGSPCQDLSVAGKHAGLKHEDNGDEETTRSGLFMEAVRIIKEMRRATNGRYPTFALWENVPGAFSSNKGEDFRIVLEKLAKIAEPTCTMPQMPKGGWPSADCYLGEGWSIAYRTFDAQHWEVPQRRRRIYLVADFGGQRAGKILFEREGLRGYFETGRTLWQGAAGNAERGVGVHDSDIIAFNILQDLIPTSGISPCITAGNSKSGQGAIGCSIRAAGFKAGQSMAGSIGYQEECAATLSAQSSGTESTVVICHDARGNGDGKTVPTITAAAGMSGNNQPCGCIAYSFDSLASNSMKSKNPHSGCRRVEISKTLDASGPDPSKNQGGIAIVQAIPTMCTCTLSPRKSLSRTSSCIARGPAAVAIKYIVRRLTPTECARLQGFLDKWGHPDHKDDFTDEEYRFWLDVRNTHAAINGKAVKEYTKAQMLTWYNKLHTDSAEYKMWGNGIALPTALYVMQGIADALTEKGA